MMIKCYNCNDIVIIYYEKRANGLRAKCPNCGINWPES